MEYLVEIFGDCEEIEVCASDAEYAREAALEQVDYDYYGRAIVEDLTPERYMWKTFRVYVYGPIDIITVHADTPEYAKELALRQTDINYISNIKVTPMGDKNSH